MSDERVASSLCYAEALLELGNPQEAEALLRGVLTDFPGEPSALSLAGKLYHLRGDLTQAVRCWAELDTLATAHKELALLHLGGILHFVKTQDPSASEFVFLSPYQLARRSHAHLALEEAFRLYLARKPEEARARCRRLAHEYQAKDRQIFKLATLASAWIAELSGDLGASYATLEGLGRVRGFEHDSDRVLALARVAERLGTPEKLEAAVNICRYLDRSYSKLSVVSRLAALYRRLGDSVLAAEYERRFLAAFRARMHRPSFAALVRAAARHYLPIADLRARSPADREISGELSVREQAMVSAVLGNDSAARDGFARGGTLLDDKYLAELCDLSGDLAAARSAFLAVHRRDPEDVRVLGWLLDHLDVDEEARRYLREPDAHARARATLEKALRVAPERAERWRQLAALAALEGAGPAVARIETRARLVAAAAARRAAPVGRVLAAGVFHFVGKAKGVIHEIWADRQPVAPGTGGWLSDFQLLGNLTPEMKEGVRSTFFAVREYARARFPARTQDLLDFSYVFKVTKDDEPSGGLSAGLPTALAFLSVFLQEPVPQDIAFTGVLVTDAHDVLNVRCVGEAEYKVKGAYNRNLRLIVLPAENRAELASTREVPAAICAEIVRFASTLDDAMRLAFGDDIFVRL